MDRSFVIRKRYELGLIVLSLLSIAIYNFQTASYIRPHDLLFPFLLYFLLKYRTSIKYQLRLGLFVIAYLLIVLLINLKDAYLFVAYNSLRQWVYFFMFLAFGKIIAENFNRYPRKLLITMIYLFTGLVLVLYLLSYLKVDPVLDYFTPFNETQNYYTLLGFRVEGVSVAIFFFALIILKKLNSGVVHYLVLTAVFILIFILNLSRQYLIIYLALLAVVFLNYGRLRMLLTTLIIGFVLMNLGHLKESLTSIDIPFLGIKLLEYFSFFSSGSFFVRYGDTYNFVLNWLSSAGSFIFGNGIGYMATFPRYNIFLDHFTGNATFSDTYSMVSFHNSDNTFSLLIVDGGVILLTAFIIIFGYSLYRLYRSSKINTVIILIITLGTALTSAHFVTNFGLIFIISFIYYYSLHEKKPKPDLLLY